MLARTAHITIYIDWAVVGSEKHVFCTFVSQVHKWGWIVFYCNIVKVKDFKEVALTVSKRKLKSKISFQKLFNFN